MYLSHYLSLKNRIVIYLPTPKSKLFDCVHPGVTYSMIENCLLRKEEGIKEIRDNRLHILVVKTDTFKKVST